MSHYAVHSPFQSDKRFAANYANTKLKLTAKAFATMIEGMDKSLGDIMDQLEGLGVADNTLIFFLGDNGTDAPLGATHEIACAAPLRGKKGTHYEGGMRVPFIAAWAKPASTQTALRIPAGVLTKQVGTIYDLFPTILSIVGVQHDGVVDGQDLSPLLAGANPKRQSSFLMHFPHDHRSKYFTVYRLGDWKLIYHYQRPAAERYELYQLANDPTESKNLTGSNPAELNRMVTSMIRALEDADAQYPRSKDDPRKILKPKPPAPTR